MDRLDCALPEDPDAMRLPGNMLLKHLMAQGLLIKFTLPCAGHCALNYFYCRLIEFMVPKSCYIINELPRVRHVRGLSVRLFAEWTECGGVCVQEMRPMKGQCRGDIRIHSTNPMCVTNSQGERYAGLSVGR